MINGVGLLGPTKRSKIKKKKSGSEAITYFNHFDELDEILNAHPEIDPIAAYDSCNTRFNYRNE